MAYVETQYQVQLDHKVVQLRMCYCAVSSVMFALLFSVTAFVIGMYVIVVLCAMRCVAEHACASIWDHCFQPAL